MNTGDNGTIYRAHTQTYSGPAMRECATRGFSCVLNGGLCMQTGRKAGCVTCRTYAREGHWQDLQRWIQSLARRSAQCSSRCKTLGYCFQLTTAPILVWFSQGVSPASGDALGIVDSPSLALATPHTYAHGGDTCTITKSANLRFALARQKLTICFAVITAVKLSHRA